MKKTIIIFLSVLFIHKSYAQILLGMAYYSSSTGALFEYNATTDVYTKKIDFDGLTNGANPAGSLMLAANGMIYGMTSQDAVSGYGVLFEYNYASNILTKKYDFDLVNGAGPQGTLIQASNGKLYGMAATGGTSGVGVLFEYDPITNTYQKKVDFNLTNGSTPIGDLTQANNGMLYGMTRAGGINDMGVLFEYNITTNILTKKIDFDGLNGMHPYGSLILATNSNLYGNNWAGGGVNSLGNLFEYNPITDTIITKYNFASSNGIDGEAPIGTLMQATNGKLYGLASGGGLLGVGTLYEYDIVNDLFTKKTDLSTINGAVPYGSLMQASNGKLYGMTTQGGANTLGMLLEYDITSNNCFNKYDFDSINGSVPTYTHLIEVAPTIGINETANNDKWSIRPNPSNGKFKLSNKNNSTINSIEIYNLLGEKMYTMSNIVPQEENEIDLSNNPNGVYFVRIYNGTKIHSEKIVIQ